MFVAWVIFHVIICIGLVLVVLLQSSKGEGLAGSAFGGGGGGGISGAVFGGRGAASFLGKATTVLAVTFMLNCLVLAFMSANSSVAIDPENVESVVTQQAQQERDEYLARQQQQAQQAADTASGNPLINVEPMPADTGGN